MYCMIDSELYRLLAHRSVIADDEVSTPAVAVDAPVLIAAGICAFALWIGVLTWS